MLLYAHVYYNLHKRKCLKQETNSPNAIVERINKQDESADPQSLKNNSNHISLPGISAFMKLSYLSETYYMA